jgi:hypothetical protein
LKLQFAFLAVAVTCAFLYLSNAPQEITRANFGGDGGDFLAAALTGGIPHPTGYPTYTILARWVQKLPFGAPFWKGALLSLLPASLSAALLAGFLAAHIERSRFNTRLFGYQITPAWVGIALGCLAALAWGVSPLLWSQAVIVEVHGLQALLVASVLGWSALLMRYQGGRRDQAVLLGLALLAGLGMGNHVTLALALPVVAVGWWFACRRGLRPAWILAQAGAFLAGMSIYIYLPLSARAYPPVNWGNPQTLAGFRWLVTAEAYQHFLLGGDPGFWLRRLAAWAGLLVQQFGIFGVFLGALGAIQGMIFTRRMNLVFLWVFAAYSLFALAYNTVDSTVYLLPAFLVFAAWIGAGLAQAVAWELKRVPVGWLLAVAFLASTLARVPATWVDVHPARDAETAVFCERVLKDLPQGALFFTRSEVDTFPMWYYHFGLKERSDLHVISLPLTQFAWYQETVLDTYPDLIAPSEAHPANFNPYLQPGWTAWAASLASLQPGRAVCWSPLALADGNLADAQCVQNP